MNRFICAYIFMIFMIVDELGEEEDIGVHNGIYIDTYMYRYMHIYE
jgi:hypothetical protein